jgi:tetratricopeptide (TPR) repeat protein
MRQFRANIFVLLLSFTLSFTFPQSGWAQVSVWEGTITIPTYGWQDDVNPKFWAMEGGVKGSTTVRASIVYPYSMQDHLSRTLEDRTYKALFLENEYLKITCLPELGGRLHSVFDKTRNQEMFHLNNVIKAGMIAMRGAFISGGVEWNAGPQVHTVTIVSPVDAIVGKNEDGSAFLEVSNIEKTLRTHWTVRLTIHPGRSYLDEKIRIFNPTDAMNPYYFWNCTAFPQLPGTRFIYPMTLGTDHFGVEFFSWPIDKGRDLSWLKNYEDASSIFSIDCKFDFFGAYDVDLDRGIVQVADHHELSGKKAWTWGQSEYGRVSQMSLADDGSAYIEVQSGPLPTQSDYGMLEPRAEVSWQEWWFPVHDLGDGFDFATKDLAVRSVSDDGRLTLRLIATGKFPSSTCTISQGKQLLLEKRIDLSPADAQVITLQQEPTSPVDVSIKSADGNVLAGFILPLPIPVTSPPDPATFEEKPDEQLSVHEIYLKAQKFDRATDRLKARKYYEMALAKDHRHLPSSRDLAVLDFEAGLYREAAKRLQESLQQKPNDDGLAWYFLGLCHLKLDNEKEAIACGHRAVRSFGATSLGYDLIGRGYMRLKQYPKALEAFTKAVRANMNDTKARNHQLLAMYANGKRNRAFAMAPRRIDKNPTDIVPRALIALKGEDEMDRFVKEARAFIGEDDFELLEASLVFAELGLNDEAERILKAACVEAVAESQRNPLPLYYMAYFASQNNKQQAARKYLEQAAGIYQDFIFASRPEAIEVLKYAVSQNPRDAQAHLQLGNLYGNLGRLEEAASCWREAAKVKPSLSVAFRNLGLYTWTSENNHTLAQKYYKKAIAARPNDQTLYRDLADILIDDGKRPEAIKVMEDMPYDKIRRAEIIIMLAQAYLDEQRFDECLNLVETTPYFVNWEGSNIVWDIFNQAHVERGIKYFENKDYNSALRDFESALTFPDNLSVGQSRRTEEAMAFYWKGKSLEALGRKDSAQEAWKTGAKLPDGSEKQGKYRQLCSSMSLK